MSAITIPNSKTAEMLDRLGLAIDAGTVVMADYTEAESCYIHHTQVPVAVTGYALVSPAFARGRFPKLSFIDVIQKRPSMDEYEAVALASLCGVEVKPPFWGNGEPFGAHLWDVIARYRLEPFFERRDRPYGRDGDHYFMRPRGWSTNDELPDVLAKWRADYRKLGTPHQLMVATVLQLYRQGTDRRWMVRVPKTWHAADGIDELHAAGFLADWARLVALYPGW